MVTLYGIKNCDTVKKARKWLDENGVDYQFHDFREDGVTCKQVRQWVDELGWETVINKRSTTWKSLDAEQRESMDAESAAAAIVEQPTLIKRPLLDTGHERHCGFNAESYRQLFRKHAL
ncbi:MAG: ArsC family reductase [Halioglobus sp.]